MKEYSPEIQNLRNKAAGELKEQRKKRDELRAASTRPLVKLKEFHTGRNYLREEADEIHNDTKHDLAAKKEAIAMQIRFEEDKREREFNYIMSYNLWIKFFDQNKEHVLLEKLTEYQKDLLAAITGSNPSIFKLHDLVHMLGESKKPCEDATSEYNRSLLQIFILNILKKSVPDMDENMSKMEPRAFMYPLIALVESGDEEAKKTALEVLIKHRSSILVDFPTLAIFKIFLNYGDEDSFNEINSIIINGLKQKDKKVLETLVMLTKNDFGKAGKIAKDYIEHIASSFGLDPQKALLAWLQSSNKARDVVENMASLLEIEEKHPGGVKFLADNFGIYDFGRYPTELLLKQIEDNERVDMPYGVVIYPRSDHNGAFMQDKKVFSKFREQLPQEYALRFFEVETQIDLARVLIKTQKRYGGSGNKISFAIVGGHGDKESVSFSGMFGYPDRGQIMSSNVSGENIGRIKDYFADDASIILVSCSTGVEEGIGQKMSQGLGLKVFAPNVPTNIKSITSKVKEGGGLEFDVEYNNKESKMEYAQGTRITG